jgi:hypothetical protein
MGEGRKIEPWGIRGGGDISETKRTISRITPISRAVTSGD